VGGNRRDKLPPVTSGVDGVRKSRVETLERVRPEDSLDMQVWRSRLTANMTKSCHQDCCNRE
jgi:hypothetical protein